LIDSSTLASASYFSSVSETRVRRQKNRAWSSTLERAEATTTKAAAAKSTLSSTLQQLGNWARRSFRSRAAATSRRPHRPNSLSDYVMAEVPGSVVVERRQVSDRCVTVRRM